MSSMRFCAVFDRRYLLLIHADGCDGQFSRCDLGKFDDGNTRMVVILEALARVRDKLSILREPTERLLRSLGLLK